MNQSAREFFFEQTNIPCNPFCSPFKQFWRHNVAERCNRDCAVRTANLAVQDTTGSVTSLTGGGREECRFRVRPVNAGVHAPPLVLTLHTHGTYIILAILVHGKGSVWFFHSQQPCVQRWAVNQRQRFRCANCRQGVYRSVRGRQVRQLPRPATKPAGTALAPTEQIYARLLMFWSDWLVQHFKGMDCPVH